MITTLLAAAIALAPVKSHATHVKATVIASYYGGREKLNRHTANGEVFRPKGLTAAHRSLPFGTKVLVCYKGCAVVRITDRGPARWTGRSIDVSKGAAEAIGLKQRGFGPVRMAVVH